MNRLDFLRLAFASAVLFFHAIVLSNTGSTETERLMALLAELSIQGFFIISGLLVYGSLVHSKNIADYAMKRIRRLYPAYVVVIFIPAIISLALTGELPAILKYLIVNLGFLNFLAPTLPGLFEGLRFEQVNGALWTLKIEVMFYLLLPVLAWALAKAGRAKWLLLLAIYVFAEIWRISVPLLDIPFATQIARQLPGQMSFFVIGISIWFLQGFLRSHIAMVGFLGAVLIALSFLLPAGFLRAAGLGGVIFFVSYLPGPTLNVARCGDLSYGVYITHFPIINLLVITGFFAHGVWSGLLIATSLVFVTSLLLWHLVEKRFLRRSSYYRRNG